MGRIGPTPFLLHARAAGCLSGSIDGNRPLQRVSQVFPRPPGHRQPGGHPADLHQHDRQPGQGGPQPQRHPGGRVHGHHPARGAGQRRGPPSLLLHLGGLVPGGGRHPRPAHGYLHAQCQGEQCPADPGGGTGLRRAGQRRRGAAGLCPHRLTN